MGARSWSYFFVPKINSRFEPGVVRDFSPFAVPDPSAFSDCSTIDFLDNRSPVVSPTQRY